MMPALQYFTLREHISADLRRGILEQSAEGIAKSIASAARVDKATAAEFTERFFNDLKRGIARRKV